MFGESLLRVTCLLGEWSKMLLFAPRLFQKAFPAKWNEFPCEAEHGSSTQLIIIVRFIGVVVAAYKKVSRISLHACSETEICRPSRSLFMLLMSVRPVLSFSVQSQATRRSRGFQVLKANLKECRAHFPQDYKRTSCQKCFHKYA